jgi:hypothetical protein
MEVRLKNEQKLKSEDKVIIEMTVHDLSNLCWNIEEQIPWGKQTGNTSKFIEEAKKLIGEPEQYY